MNNMTNDWKLVGEGSKGSVYLSEKVVAKIFEEEAEFIREVYFHCYFTTFSTKYTSKILKVDLKNQVLYMKRETMDFHDFFFSNKLTFRAIKQFFYQICKCVQFLHKLKVAHLDLKLENFLINTTTKRITLTDFGFCHRFDEGPSPKTVLSINSKRTQQMNQFLRQYKVPTLGRKLKKENVGTKHFQCMEIINKQEFDVVSADVWALGVILHVMIVGEYPLFDRDGKFISPSSYLLDPLSGDLFVKIFVPEANRISLSDIFEHKFFNDKMFYCV